MFSCLLCCLCSLLDFSYKAQSENAGVVEKVESKSGYDPNPYKRPGEKNRTEKIEVNLGKKEIGNRETTEETGNRQRLNRIRRLKKDIKNILSRMIL